MPNCEPSFSRTIGMCEAKRPEAPKVTSVPSGRETINACITDTRFSSLCLGIYICILGYILNQPPELAASTSHAIASFPGEYRKQTTCAHSSMRPKRLRYWPRHDGYGIRKEISAIHVSLRLQHQPNVNANACTPGSRNSISKPAACTKPGIADFPGLATTLKNQLICRFAK